MQYTYPSYFFAFQCVGSSCPDTCCAGWKIEIDSESLKRYRKETGKALFFSGCRACSSRGFARKLFSGIDFHRGMFRLVDRRCAFLDPDNLCRIYQKLGKDALCKTCRTYPRHMEEYGLLREISLSLSCPEAANLILHQPTLPEMQVRYSRRTCAPEEKVDELLLFALLNGRQTVMKLLWETEAPSVKAPDIGAAMALAFTHDLQRRILQNRLSRESLDTLSAKYLALDASCAFMQQFAKGRADHGRSEWEGKRVLWLTNVIRLFATLEPVEEEWPMLMKKLEAAVKAAADRKAVSAEGIPAESVSGGNQAERNLLTYFVMVYYPGAVYDRNVFGNMQLAVVSWLMIRTMARLLPMKIERAAWLYSREVENSDENLKTLAAAFRNHALFSRDILLEIILGR